MKTNKVAQFLYWIRSSYFDQGRVSDNYDQYLNDLLDGLEAEFQPGELKNGLVNKLTEDGISLRDPVLTVPIKGVEFWVANFPYAFGGPRNIGKYALPKVSTRFRFLEFLVNYMGLQWVRGELYMEPPISREESIKDALERVRKEWEKDFPYPNYKTQSSKDSGNAE